MKIGSKTKVTREVTRQERNRRNNMKRITVSALVAIVLFIALTIIQSSILNQEQKLEAYQVIKDIKSGTKITEDNLDEYFRTIKVQTSLIPDGYITDPQLIIGKFVNRDYKAKDIVTTDGLKDSEALYNSKIKNPVEVSFSIGGLSDSVSGTIREGDYVNIYGMRNGYNQNMEVVSMTSETYTFKHIFIEKAYDSSGVEILSSDKESQALLFTIVIEESDVDLFNEMIANCGLKMVKLMYDTDEDYKAYLNKSNTTNKNSQSSQENNVVSDTTEETNTSKSDSKSESGKSTGDITGDSTDDSGLNNLKEQVQKYQKSNEEN